MPIRTGAGSWSIALVPALALLTSLPQPAGAQWYLGVDLGASLARRASLSTTDNDWSTRCDLLSNPAQIETDGQCGVQPPNAMWENEVDGAAGTRMALSLGYRLGRVRIEAEYSQRTNGYGEATPVRIGDVVTLGKADQELEEVDNWIDGLIAHGVFANAYVDLASGSDWTPYVGLGAGLASVSMEYFSRWKRNDDPALITTFVDPAMRARIAGTTSIAAGRKSDIVVGWQALAGIDRRLSEALTLGLKARWTVLGEFRDEDEYVQVRSHESTVGRGERLLHWFVADDLSAFEVGISLRFRL